MWELFRWIRFPKHNFCWLHSYMLFAYAVEIIRCVVNNLLCWGMFVMSAFRVLICHINAFNLWMFIILNICVLTKLYALSFLYIFINTLPSYEAHITSNELTSHYVTPGGNNYCWRQWFIMFCGWLDIKLYIYSCAVLCECIMTLKICGDIQLSNLIFAKYFQNKIQIKYNFF